MSLYLASTDYATMGSLRIGSINAQVFGDFVQLHGQGHLTLGQVLLTLGQVLLTLGQVLLTLGQVLLTLGQGLLTLSQGLQALEDDLQRKIESIIEIKWELKGK